MTATTTVLNLSAVTSVLNDIIQIAVQYLPLIATVAITLGVVSYFFNGIGGAFGSITSLFSGG